MVIIYALAGGLIFLGIILTILLIIAELEKQYDYYFNYKETKKSDEFIKELEDMTDE